MIYAYVRVSTDKQINENQKLEIAAYCRSRQWKIDKWCIDNGVSGAKDYRKRTLGKLISSIKTGDTLIACEISRLGRDLFMIMEILRKLMEKNVKLYTIKDNFQLTDEIQCKCIAFAFGLAAEIERKLISQRTKAALSRLKAQGKKLGRKPGNGRCYVKLKGHEEDVIKMLTNGISKQAISRKFKIHVSTLYRFIQIRGLKEFMNHE